MESLFKLFQQPGQQIVGFFPLAVPIGFKVVMAIICGGMVGIERELKGKPAGFKTQILICLGACLYTIVSTLVSMSFADSGYHGDPARIAAQVVSGIGFIGAGAIMQSRVSVVGLTTAATIWTVAAIGMCIGAGYPLVAVVFTMTVLFTLLAIDKLENKFIGRDGSWGLEIIFDDPDGAVRSQINQVMTSDEIALDDFDISRSGENYVLRMQHTASPAVHKRFILDLWGIKGIREVRQV
jgi:putative Mg2+ transporter-C (MgtC) family protein